MMDSIWIGFDARWPGALAVARQSAERYAIDGVDIRGIVLGDMREQGLYWRPTSQKGEQLWDDISEAPMATEFAISRFLTPHLARRGFALFMDCDMLVRGYLRPIFDHARAHPEIAVWCVKHDFAPPEGVKMDGQLQTLYARKNWSSVMLFNVEHPSNAKLTVDLINTVPGRDLHRFCWLEDHEIGELPAQWNYLVGHTRIDEAPQIVHFTDGIPSMPGYENVEYADEWRAVLHSWAR